MLVPPEDLMSAVLKKPTFHYINVLPMHKGLIELWDYITELIRKNFKNTKVPTYKHINSCQKLDQCIKYSFYHSKFNANLEHVKL